MIINDMEERERIVAAAIQWQVDRGHIGWSDANLVKTHIFGNWDKYEIETLRIYNQAAQKQGLPLIPIPEAPTTPAPQPESEPPPVPPRASAPEPETEPEPKPEARPISTEAAPSMAEHRITPKQAWDYLVALDFGQRVMDKLANDDDRLLVTHNEHAGANGLPTMNEKRSQRLLRHPIPQAQPEIYGAVLDILYRHDPVGICISENPQRETEYANEVDTMLPRLEGAASESDVRKIVHEEFVRWFNGYGGPEERYSQIAAEIWKLIDTA